MKKQKKEVDSANASGTQALKKGREEEKYTHKIQGGFEENRKVSERKKFIDEPKPLVLSHLKKNGCMLNNIVLE